MRERPGHAPSRRAEWTAQAAKQSAKTLRIINDFRHCDAHSAMRICRPQDLVCNSLKVDESPGMVDCKSPGNGRQSRESGLESRASGRQFRPMGTCVGRQRISAGEFRTGARESSTAIQ